MNPFSRTDRGPRDIRTPGPRISRVALTFLALAACAAPIDDEDEIVDTTESALATGTGLTGRYYRGVAFDTLAGERVDPRVDFNWDLGAPMAGMPVDLFSVRWTGQVEAPASGTFTFTTTSDDGVRLSVNGATIIDDWTRHATKDVSGTVTLVAGQRYDIALEYFENTGRAVARLSWAHPGQARQIVPTARLYPAAPPPPPPMNIYFGSTHNHTGCCNDHGTDGATAGDVLAAAKASGFDFLFLTEHSGRSGPASVPMDPATFWADVKAQVARHTDASFVGVAGYEFSDNDGGGGIAKGHMTGANTDAFVSADGAGSNAETLEDYLVSQAAAGRPAYGGFNHPGAGGHPGSAAALLTPARRNVIVMSEVHNSYESASDGASFTGLIAELDRGWRVAPVCGLDGHGLFRIKDTSPEPGPCRTGMLAPSLTKANLDAAFMARRVYSSRDKNLRVSFKANGQWMGSQIGRPPAVAFDISVSDPDTGNAADRIKKIEILTEGGAVAASKTFDQHAVTWQVSIPANGKKYFLLRIFNGERATYTAATAPVWLE